MTAVAATNENNIDRRANVDMMRLIMKLSRGAKASSADVLSGSAARQELNKCSYVEQREV